MSEPRSKAAKVETLGEALLREMARVRDEVLPFYTHEVNGQRAAAMMRRSLDVAAKAMAEGDVVAMIAAHEDLKVYRRRPRAATGPPHARADPWGAFLAARAAAMRDFAAEGKTLAEIVVAVNLHDEAHAERILRGPVAPACKHRHSCLVPICVDCSEVLV